jgi:hypothetical protein
VSGLQRFLLIASVVLMPSLAWCAAAEMITITGTATGATAGLCSFGTPAAPNEHGLFVHILDNSVYYTIHSPTATPSAALGGLAVANTILQVDRASDFRATAVGANARGYLVCVPR